MTTHDHTRVKTLSPAASALRVFRGVLCHASIVLACILVYGQTLRFGLTRFDDDLLLGAVSGRPVSLVDVFTKDAFLNSMDQEAGEFYRPLQTLTYMADVRFGGKEAYGCHGTNLLLYVLACSALLTLLRRLGYGHGVALVSVLVYSLDPLFTQVVAWIPARGDLLLALSALVSFIALIRFRETGRRWFLALHLTGFLLAELSKEAAVMLPVVFAVHIVCEDGVKKLLNRQNAILLSAWVVLLGAYLILRGHAIGRIPGPDLFGVRSFLGNLATIPEALSNFVWPVNLSVLPSFTAFRTVTGLILLAAIAMCVALQREKRWAPILFGTTWFLILSMPGMFYSQEMGIHAYSYLNHRMFLPMMGILIVAVELVPVRWRTSRPWASSVVGSVLAGVLAVLSFRHSRTFSTQRTFYDQAVRTNPRSALALYNRGNIRNNDGDLRDAVEDYSRALQIYPSNFSAHLNRGVVMARLGDFPAAIADLTAVIRKGTPSVVSVARAYYNRAVCKSILGDQASALEDYNEVIRRAPEQPDGYTSRGDLRHKMGDDVGALQDFEAAWKRDPRLPEPLFQIGLIRHERNDEAGARAAWQAAAALGHPGAQERLRKQGLRSGSD